MKAEEVAQLSYEGLRDEGLALKSDLIEKKTSLEAAIAKRGREKEAEEADKLDNERDLEAEQDYKASITNDCDFIIRTFTKRATARVAEMRGLTGAKEYLVGANPSTAEFLQRRGCSMIRHSQVRASSAWGVEALYAWTCMVGGGCRVRL